MSLLDQLTAQTQSGGGASGNAWLTPRATAAPAYISLNCHQTSHQLTHQSLLNLTPPLFLKTDVSISPGISPSSAVA